jgi:3-hydroxyisobutyrate dehydrogenase
MTGVGWVGLGAMGLPMAGCIARAGYEMTAYDIDPGRAASLAADGVRPAASISEVASGVDVLVLMVATPGQVEGRCSTATTRRPPRLHRARSCW